MVSIAKRIEELRSSKNINRVQLAAELGFPKMAIEKFETGRLTPSKDQQEKLAKYFGVSLEYLKGESDDKNTMFDWLSGNVPEETVKPVQNAVKPKIIAQSGNDKSADDSAMLSILLKSDAFKKAVLEILKTPEGKELIRKATGK